MIVTKHSIIPTLHSKTNYDLAPTFQVSGKVFSGWDLIMEELNRRILNSHNNRYILIVECYQGVHHDEIQNAFQHLNAKTLIESGQAFYSEEKIREITFPDVTDDAVFGYMTSLTFHDLIDPVKVDQLRSEINAATGLVVVYGHGASLIADSYDCLVYVDMARWEIQQRQRNHEINNLGIRNSDEAPGIQYKRGFFVDWRICDRLKQQLFEKADYWLDTNHQDEPKMMRATEMLKGLDEISQSPFRVVPYFDPGPWGGQWMKQVFGLDKSKSNYAWSFDGVPEENSLLFDVDGVTFEIPAINLVFYKSTELLGKPVEDRFGKEFPIRFDLLDTMEGGNLSFQVHPSASYIKEKFGMGYTQDESYYMLDAKPGAVVFLGLKTGSNTSEMIDALKTAQETGCEFDAGKYVNKFPARKHDHFLIPNGTVHCSGANGMVLEISATPYIFTFKMYDWGRLGLDGEPRAINIDHGANVIETDRDTQFCLDELVNQVELLDRGDGWREERTGLHRTEFIETRRHWFTKTVTHYTGNSVNVLNLVEGREAIVESPAGAFKPFIVHYAETFIVPARVGTYTIRPYGESIGAECATLKAFVRTEQ